MSTGLEPQQSGDATSVLSYPAPPGAAEFAREVQGSPPAPLPKGGNEDQGSTIWQVVSAAASTALRNALSAKGYIPPDALKNKTLSDAILDTRKRVLINRILFSGLDNRPILNMVDAVLVTLGVDPRQVPIMDKLEVFSKSYPAFSGLAYFLLGEEKYDALFGRAGSPMLLAKGILEAYGPSRIDGSSAVSLAHSLNMVFSMNPALTKGFNGETLAKVLQHAVRSGIITPTSDANVFIRQVTNVLPVYGAVRDVLKKELHRDPTPDELTQAVPKILEQYSGMPFDRMTKQLRRDIYVNSLSPHGLFHAGVQAAGIQVPVAPDIYVKDDLTLRQNILDSPVGNMAGATARAVQMYGKRGPLGDLYDSIVAGRMPVLMPGQWVEMAVKSGLPAPVAFSLLQQHERNKSFVTPEIIQGVRAAQFQYDIAPVIDQINMMYPDPELRAGALAEYAKKLGYRGVGNIDPGSYMMLLHSNAVHSGIKKVLNEADYFATVDESASHLQGFSPIRSISQYLLDTQRKKKLGIPAPFDLGRLVEAVRPVDYGVPTSFMYPAPINLSSIPSITGKPIGD